MQIQNTEQQLQERMFYLPKHTEEQYMSQRVNDTDYKQGLKTKKDLKAQETCIE